MSPEQARGLAVDSRSDLFSLALVLFNASSGRTLYSGNSNFELLNRAAAGLTSVDRVHLAELPPGLGEVLTRALQQAPENRFQTAEEFWAALSAVGVPATADAVQRLMDAMFHDALAEEVQRFSGQTGRVGT